MKAPLLIIILFSVLSVTCNKDHHFGPYIPPYSIYFLIKNNGNRLPDSVLDNMKMYYYQNNVKTYVCDFSRSRNAEGLQAYDLGIQTTRDAGFISGDQNIKTFYLHYEYGPEDTVFIDNVHLNEKQATQDPCYCHYPLRSVKFNGQAASTDPAIHEIPVYIFSKL